jgi:negative regulator of flagellin synthesis FlgM
MKIDNSLKPVGSAQGADARLRVVHSAQASPAEGPRVQLSALSASLQKAETALGGMTEVNRARVEEVRQAMADGRFKPDAARIADGLLSATREAFTAGRSFSNPL